MRQTCALLGRLVGCFVLAIFVASSNEGVAKDTRPRVTAWDLATLIDIDGLSVSPDGRWAAFQTRKANPDTNSYTLSWYVASIGGGKARLIAEGGEPQLYATASPRIVHGAIVTAPPAWSPDSRWIVYSRQDKGHSQLWRSSVDGHGAEQLTHNEGEMLSEGYSASFRYSRDGSRLFFETRLSEAQLKAVLAAEGRGGFHFDDRFTPSYSPHPLAPIDARMDLFGDISNPAGTQTTNLWVYDFASKRERRADEAEVAEYAALRTPPAAPAGRSGVRANVIASGGAVAWTEARDPDLQGSLPPMTLAAQPSGADAPVICQAAVCTGQFARALLWRNAKEVLFTMSPTDRLDERALYAWRPGSKTPPRMVLRTRALLKDPTWDCAIAQDRLICFYEEQTRPRRLVAINLDSGSIDTLYDPNPGWARFDLGPEPQVIDVRPTSTAHAPSYLVLPPDYRPGQRLPLVIVTYNCQGFLRGGVGDEYPVFPLAAQGFAVLCHNHLQNDWALEAKESVEDRVREQRAPGEPFQRRIQAGLDYAVADLNRRGLIDPDRVGLTGLSMGQQTVRWALFNMPKLTAAIASSASTESVSFTLGTREMRRFQRELFGLDSLFSPRFQTLSLARNVDKVRAPYLVNVSDQELLDSVETIGALEDAGRAVDAYVFPDEYHVKWQPVHRLAVYIRNIDWMNFWLRGEEGDATGKAAQYEHWRALRESQCGLFTGAKALPDPPWYCRARTAATAVKGRAGDRNVGDQKHR